jgi:cytochrome P450
LILGYDDDCKLAESLSAFFEYISSRFLKQTINQDKIDRAVRTFWEIIDCAIRQKKGLTAYLVEDSQFNEKEMRMILFSLLFAGTDSTTTSLIYCLLKCAQKQHTQAAMIRDPKLIKRFIMEGLRMFTPVIGVMRIARKNLSLTVENGDQTIEKYIQKGELIVPSQNLAARCPALYSDANYFNSERHAGKESMDLISLPWKPFGDGKHACPGWYLYQLTAEILLEELVKNYEITTDITEEPQQTGHFINKLQQVVVVSLSKKK